MIIPKSAPRHWRSTRDGWTNWHRGIFWHGVITCNLVRNCLPTSPHAIAEDLHSLKGLSQGEFVELNWGAIDGHATWFNHLNVYVTTRYYWDADQDIEALLNEYYEKFYGPAAKEMKAFIE